jgi:hypothetical protein
LGVDAARRQEIFRILQGGGTVYDPSLAKHLWQVAGNLAKRDWHPPRVTIEVVVRTLDEPK